ncbi:xanthine dehydrogenase family protein molybdopterin-binding subunit [Nitratidesulfovibrio liaohensis]|uniref:Xanthine dehydrogenase family protein molybdopterin-binding subunit n=1 Tax=Nitratidesulfovibrio liaohensis TaxID=2604158 RepID=A0ABY9R715_9BACT|nr:xanthine dehydrogenase family protein molybdopterin-binding subunit [Nitratidesulfovibrio liaohensis]WMW66912.1 xanthine dehydrogenase family protein molybdopterin-binding subunit [Nitratidesulfovibrio liaohensis]
MSEGPYDIGPGRPRLDALAKACGTERFSADVYPPDLLWAGACRAGIPHGRIRAVHTDEAARLPGVHAVLVRSDVPGTNRQGIVHKDMPVLCGDKVRHAGDPVALVVAESRTVLQQALALVRMDIDPLPVLGDMDAALADGAPLVHEGHGSNILLAAEIRKGNAEAALRECDVVIEETFHTPSQAHAFLETENGVAHLDGNGVLHLTVSTQAPFRDRFEMGHALGLPPWNIRIRNPFLGGGFGGKDGATVQCLLGLAALRLPGRTIKMWWDREESLLAGYKRHAARMHYTLGAMRDGTLKAVTCRLHYDTGAYAHLGGEIMELGMEHAAGPYRVEHMDCMGWCVYTNNPVAGAFRGFGVAQVSLAFEGMMDRLADRLGMDRLELRQRNALRRGDRNCAGVTLTTSTGLGECLRRVAEHEFWTGREAWKRAAPPFTRRGVGVAAVFNGMGYGRGLADSAIAKIELTPEGRFVIHSGVTDMGQGNASTYAQIAGEVLCQDAGRLTVPQPDTETAHPSGSASAGRTTYTFGKALIAACERMAEKLFRRAALVLLADTPEGFTLVPGAVRHLPTGRDVPLTMLGTMLPRDDRICVGEYMMPVSREVPDTGKDFVIGFPHLIFPYAAHLVRIELDELTGSIRVCDYLAATDGGRVLNPVNFHQQIEGGVAQGLGFALMEDFATHNGHIRTRDLSTYLIPTSLDLPDTVSVAVDTVEQSGPFGMKGVGEVGLNGPLPAVASAVSDATGAHPDRGPLDAETVLHLLARGARA